MCIRDSPKRRPASQDRGRPGTERGRATTPPKRRQPDQRGAGATAAVVRDDRDVARGAARSGARGGSLWRLPLLCVRSDVSRRAASCARVSRVLLLASLLRSRPMGPALNYCARAPRGGLVGRRRRRVLRSVVGDWDVWGRDGGVLGPKCHKRAIFCSRLQDDVSGHAEGSLLAEGSEKKDLLVVGGLIASWTELIQGCNCDRMRGAGAASDLSLIHISEPTRPY